MDFEILANWMVLQKERFCVNIQDLFLTDVFNFLRIFGFLLLLLFFVHDNIACNIILSYVCLFY